MPVSGIALIALSLNGSGRIAAIFSEVRPVSAQASPVSAKAPVTPGPQLRHEAEAALQLSSAGKYLESREMYHDVARQAERSGQFLLAAKSWSNAGACSLLRQEFSLALTDFLHARQVAETAHEPAALGSTLNNLASLYNQMGNPQAALGIAREALAAPDHGIDSVSAAKIRYQMGHALAVLNRMEEAEPLYRRAISDLEMRHDFDTAARVRGNFGIDLIDAGRYSEAETVLKDGVALVRRYRLPMLGNLLRGLARVESRQDKPDAESLFQAAIDAPPGIAPRWNLFADRGDFRLQRGNLPGALRDFREARRLETVLRADVVPADQDRLALEGSLSQVMIGLVDAGNRLARQNGSQPLLEETFDVAEQARLWSLRALVPSTDDWRSRLPARYWDLLASYRQTQSALPARPSAKAAAAAEKLRTDLDEMEAQAGTAGLKPVGVEPVSALSQIRQVLAAESLRDDSVLFSFEVSNRGGWVWAVDAQGTSVYPLPAREHLRAEIAAFAGAVRQRNPAAPVAGAALYRELFGAISPRYLAHARWLFELDGPLFDLPFSALVLPEPSRRPVYLAERKVLEWIPGALLFGVPAPAQLPGGFLGVGDAIYNKADSRFRGQRGPVSGMVLPRLPGTAAELNHCSREWGDANTTILTGENANRENVAAAMARQPAIIHFATHVISGISQDDENTGLIALSLDRTGRLGLLGPSEIAARSSHAGLIVLDGCNSGAGAVLPASGLLGLTRAWIGSGARAVLATRWDVPDGEAETFMVEFYRWLRLRGVAHAAQALSDTQSALLKNDTFRANTNLWAAYYLLGRQ